MSDFEDISIKSVGISAPSLLGIRIHSATFTLTDRPDQKWRDCFWTAYHQSVEREIELYKQIVDRHKQEYPENVRRYLEEIFGPAEDEWNYLKSSSP
jgi:hypothetical protein